MRTLFFISLSILSFFNANAQTKTYKQALGNAISKISESSSDYEQTLALAKDFEALSKAKDADWLAYYYSSYCYTMTAFLAQDFKQVDALADKAKVLIDKANELEKNNSEISCIYSLIASARIMVNPASRGQQYGMLASQALQKAKFQNPNNPRVYFLEAQSRMYMPEAYGGGCKNALPILLVAKEKFENYETPNALTPNWGYSGLLGLLKSCE